MRSWRKSVGSAPRAAAASAISRAENGKWRITMTGLKTLVAAEWAWSCLAVRLLSLEQTTLMRQQVVLLPHPAPRSIIPTTPHPAPSSATMVVAMPVSDASSKESLNHNDQRATPHGGASCCDSAIDDLHWYPGVSLS